jgi:thiamine-monophosphate kinase
VSWIRQRAVPGRGLVALGIGDDASLVRVAPGRELVLTADMLLEGVHFDFALHPAESAGHRALARSLSDVAAMGGTPRFALLSLAVSPRAGRAWAEAFYRGFFRLARRFRTTLVGGDTAVSLSRVFIDVAVAGEVERGHALRRSGARVGDAIFVSGQLGLAALGLRWLQRPRGLARRWLPRPPGRNLALALHKHLYPEPRCALGRFLSRRKLASAAIDLSDGLASDLARLCEASDVGATIDARLIPFPEVPMPPPEALRLALEGGEDYELLFTVPARQAKRIPAQYQGVPLTQIGIITRKKQRWLIGLDGRAKPLAAAGYDHFARASSRRAP